MKKLLAATFCLCLAIGVAHGQFEQFAVSNIEPSIIEGAKSIVRQDDTVVEIKGGKAVYTYSYAVTVLDKSNDWNLAFRAYYQDGVDKVDNIKIVIIDADGEIVKKVKKKELQTYNVSSYELIGNLMAVTYSHETVEYPATIHFTYTYTDSRPTMIKRWVPIRYFDKAVEESTFQIRNMDGISLTPKPFNFDGYNIVQEGDVYRMTNQKAVISEKYIPSLAEILPRLHFQLEDIKYFDLECKATSWPELSDWIYREMYVPRQTCTAPTLKTDLDDYVGSLSDSLEVAVRLYQYIQKNFRYVAISLDDGGYIPLETKKVHELRYGDCKALSLYYQTLLWTYGIASDLVLVNSGRTLVPIDQELVTPTAFDHVINRVSIDGKDYWVDCTSNSKPFGYLGSHSDARAGLILTPKGGDLTKTPSYPNKTEINLSTTLSEGGSVEGSVEVLSTGLSMDSKLMQLPQYTDKEYMEYLTDRLLKKYDNCKVSDKSYSLDTTTLTLRENYRFEAADEVEILGDYLLVSGNNLSLGVPRLSKDPNRVFPIHFNRDREMQIVEEMSLPAGAHVSPLEDIVLESSYGKYHHKVSIDAGRLMIDRSFTIRRGTYAPEDYNGIKTFFDKIRKTERRQVTINLKS